MEEARQVGASGRRARAEAHLNEPGSLGRSAFPPQGACTGSCIFYCWLGSWAPAASLSLSLTSLPVTLPTQGSLSMRDAKASELSLCGHYKQSL